MCRSIRETYTEWLLQETSSELGVTPVPNKGVVCLESHRLLAGVSPAVVITGEPRSRRPVLLEDRGC